MKIGDTVKVKNTNQKGILRLLFGYPPRKALVSLFPGADSGYQYVTMLTENGIELEALNEFDFVDIMPW